MVGVMLGYGLSLVGIEEIKECFVKQSSVNTHILESILENSETNQGGEEEGNKIVKTEESTSFGEKMKTFLILVENCSAIQHSMFSLIKGYILNFFIKGLVYAIGGFTGLMIKGLWDTYKLKTHIDHFNDVRNNTPINYTELGSDVGKIIRIIQNIALRKKFRWLN